jgi:hypothetical protein
MDCTEAPVFFSAEYMLTCGCFGLVFLIGVFSFSADHKLNGHVATMVKRGQGRHEKTWSKMEEG